MSSPAGSSYPVALGAPAKRPDGVLLRPGRRVALLSEVVQGRPGVLPLRP